MLDFGYSRPDLEDEVMRNLSEPDTMAIAGGTELLNWMRLGIAAPAQLVDLAGLPNLSSIVIDGPWLEIGAACTLNTVGEHPAVLEHAAGLASACLQAASAQIRNRATLGGNVLQRTRCAYFRTEEPVPAPCNKRSPGSGCAALSGANDQHAIFGWTPDCVAVQPSDPLVALTCLDAEVDILSPSGHHWMPVAELHLTQQEAAADGQDPARIETRLGADELIRRYRIPVVTGRRSAYVKVRERVSYAYALVSAAASVRQDGPGADEIHIVLGSVAQRPWRLLAAEQALQGEELTSQSVAAAVEQALTDARPLSANRYKLRLARSVATRAVMEAAQR